MALSVVGLVAELPSSGKQSSNFFYLVPLSLCVHTSYLTDKKSPLCCCWDTITYLLLLWLLCKHSRHLGHQLEGRPGLDGVQPHVRSSQVLHLTMLEVPLASHLLLLDWSCYKGMSCRRVQHWCTVHVHWEDRIRMGPKHGSMNTYWG